MPKGTITSQTFNMYKMSIVRRGRGNLGGWSGGGLRRRRGGFFNDISKGEACA